MKTINELVEQTALNLTTESLKAPVLSISIFPHDDKENDCHIEIPKVFLEEFAKLVIEDYKALNT